MGPAVLVGRRRVVLKGNVFVGRRVHGDVRPTARRALAARSRACATRGASSRTRAGDAASDGALRGALRAARARARRPRRTERPARRPGPRARQRRLLAGGSRRNRGCATARGAASARDRGASRPTPTTRKAVRGELSATSTPPSASPIAGAERADRFERAHQPDPAGAGGVRRCTTLTSGGHCMPLPTPPTTAATQRRASEGAIAKPT